MPAAGMSGRPAHILKFFPVVLLLKRFSAFLLAVCLVFTLCSCGSDKTADRAFQYRIEGRVSNLDPQLASDPDSILAAEHIFEGLFRLTESGSIVPGAVKDYAISDDSLTYTFTLREDLVWTNGKTKDKIEKPVTAADFAFGLRRALLPETAAPDAQKLFCIKNAEAVHSGGDASALGVTAPDEKTLVIELGRPCENLTYLLTLPVSMPCNEDFFNSTKGKYGLEQDSILANGMFCVNKFNSDYLKLSRNKQYHSVGDVVPSSVLITFGQTEPDIYKALISGESDVAKLPSARLDAAKKEGLTIQEWKDTSLSLVLNADSASLQSASLRAALAQDIDRDAIEQELYGTLSRSEGLIPPACEENGTNYLEASGGFLYAYDPVEAKISLNEALGSEKLSGVTIIHEDIPELNALVLSFVHVWQIDLGVYINPEPLKKSELEKRVAEKNYQIALLPLTSTDNSATQLLSLFSADGGRLAGTPSAAFSSQFREAMNSGSVSSIQRAEETLITEGYVIPICYDSSFYALSKDVVKLDLSPSGGRIHFRHARKN